MIDTTKLLDFKKVAVASAICVLLASCGAESTDTNSGTDNGDSESTATSANSRSDSGLIDPNAETQTPDSGGEVSEALLTEPQSVDALKGIVANIESGDAIAEGNKLTFFPEIPIPDEAKFFSYKTELSKATLGEGFLGSSIEYFLDVSQDEAVTAFTESMEEAGWKVEAEESSSTKILKVDVPDFNFPLEISIYGSQHRGATLAILKFSANGDAFAKIGNLEVWSGLTQELNVPMPEGGTPAGGGVYVVREPVAKEEAKDPVGQFLQVTHKYEPQDKQLMVDAVTKAGVAAGYTATAEGARLVLTKDAEKVEYKIQPNSVTASVQV